MSKKNIIYIAAIVFTLVFGIWSLIHNEGGEGNGLPINKNNALDEDTLNTMESTNETIEYLIDLDSSELEQEEYNERQMYFENVEVLYEYISFIRFEDIKILIENYIHANINSNIRDCSILPESIIIIDEDIEFEVAVSGVTVIKIEVKNFKSVDTVNIIPLQ